MNRPLIALPVIAALALTACGGSDDSSSSDASTDDEAAVEAPAPAEEPAESADASGDADDAAAGGASDVDAGTGVSGGPIADDWGRICELLDAQLAADVFGIEPVAQVNGAGGGTGLCQYGANAEVQLVVTDPGEQLGISAQESFDGRVAFERDSNGRDVGEAPLMGLPRATWIEDGGTARTIVALEPYVVEMSDTNGQDIVIAIAIGGVLDALR